VQYYCEVDQEELRGALNATGHRWTRQRAAIVQAIGGAAHHFSAADIYSAARLQAADLRPSTVYRTLVTLRDVGLVAEAPDPAGGKLYSRREGAGHHHLACRRCGTMIPVEDALLDPLREVIRDRFGFEVDFAHHTIPGRCARCAR